MCRFQTIDAKSVGEVPGGIRVYEAFLGDDDDLVLNFGAFRVDIDSAAEVDRLIARLTVVRSHLWQDGEMP